MPSIVIAQGGGPTAVINQTLCGAVLAARRHDPSVRILGARYGVRGLTAGNVVDLTTMPEAELRRLGNTPNSALGSTRDKPDSGACSDILAALDRLGARAFVYIGGNDTAGTLELLRQQSSGPCHFVHAPKTIDNDLMENDHVPASSPQRPSPPMPLSAWISIFAPCPASMWPSSWAAMPVSSPPRPQAGSNRPTMLRI
jgi:6-phosphofructokinase 1